MSIKTENMFNYFWFEYYFWFFTNKSAVQNARLHDSSAVQRLETDVHCKMHGTYLSPAFLPPIPCYGWGK